MISYSEALKLNKRGNVIPVFERIPADLDTPVGAFLKLAQGKRDSFLLESIEGGEKLARYSFLGFDPFLIIEGEADRVVLMQGRSKRVLEADPIEFVKEMFRFYRPVKMAGLPRFTGGGVGYFSYDTVRWIEDIPDDNPDTIGLPSMRLAMYRHLVVFDHLRQEILVIANILHESGESGFKARYQEACATVRKLIKRLQSARVKVPNDQSGRPRIKADYTKREFESMVRKAKRYIKEGDIFQVVLSQRWQVKSDLSALTLYRRLRRINPSPYMFMVNCGNSSVIGSSPEMMVRVEGRAIETRPIAGTRPRGKDETEDKRMVADLLGDAKELAEHTMLLDLGRNDLGRVSRPGSVKVAEKMLVEKYSHVIHLVSSVVGKMKPKIAPLEGLFSCFPAGTVSGAPKIRAMEIIDELEKERRGVYAGTVAYLDFWGNLDSCIAIRTVVKRGDTFYIQAGAGIVADSKPAREYRETEAKAKVLLTAITGREDR
ncbi:MAG: anthranilate synthase component I [candidate division Zixibacteria bacterium]|nr:anthranilate synthase component I [candidate division Zixibacteria bacterium]